MVKTNELSISYTCKRSLEWEFEEFWRDKWLFKLNESCYTLKIKSILKSMLLFFIKNCNFFKCIFFYYSL